MSVDAETYHKIISHSCGKCVFFLQKENHAVCSHDNANESEKGYRYYADRCEDSFKFKEKSDWKMSVEKVTSEKIIKPKILNVSLMVEPTLNGFTKAMRAVAGEYREIAPGEQNFNHKVVEIAKEFKPDIIFLQIQKENVITEEAAQELSKIAFVMNFSGDIRDELPMWYLNIGRKIHLSAFSNMQDVNVCKANGVKADWLEIGIDPERYRKHNVKKDTSKIVAHLNNYGNEYPLSAFRIELVDRMKKEFGDDFGVFGNGWNGKESGNFNSNQVDESINYNNALIAISVSHFQVEKYSSDRLGRAVASGCFTLQHNFPKLEELYTPKKHLDTFNTIDELIEKCKYYLEHHEEREKIALAGMKHCVQNYSFNNMCSNIVKLWQKWK